MNGLFNPTFSAPAPNEFGPIGSQLSTISNSSSPTSTNSGEPQMDSIIWLGAVGTSLSATNLSPVNDFTASIPFNNESNSFFTNATNVCGSCDRLTPENHCYDCSDSLCNHCVALHMRNLTNKNHTVQKINSISPPTTALSRLTPHFPSPRHHHRFATADAENQCDIHYEILRYVCESCKIIICQECSLRDHKEHQCTFIDTYVEQPLKTIQDLMEVASAGKHQIKKCIDRVMRYSSYLDRDVSEILQRNRKNGVRTPNGPGSVNNAISNALLRCEEKDHVFAELLEKFRQQKNALYLDQQSNLRASLYGIATVTDDLKKIRKILNEFTPFELAKALIDADNKIDHFMKQTNKLVPVQVNVQQFLISLERRNDQQQLQQPHPVPQSLQTQQQQQQQQLTQQQIVPDLQHLMQTNSNLLHSDHMAALVASTSQMSLIANNNAAKSLRRPIVRSNRGIHQNNGGQLLLPPNMGQHPSTSAWNASTLTAMSMPLSTSNDVVRMTNNEMFLNFNGFSAATAQQYMSSATAYNFNDEPPAVGRCIFNLDGVVVAVRRNEPTLSFAYDGPLEGQLSRPWGVCVDKGNEFRSVVHRTFSIVFLY